MSQEPPEQPEIDAAESVDLAAKGTELDKSLVSGLAWTGAVRWGTQLFKWVATFVVARLLAPADYGLVGMSMVYLGVVNLVNEFGLGAAIVQRHHLTRDQIARLGGLSVLLGVAFFLLSIALADPIARFYREDAVRGIIIVLSTTFVISGAQVLPRSLLVRDLAFSKTAWIDGVEGLAAATSMLLLAALGANYWALVFGTLIGKTCATIVAIAWRPHRIAFPRRLSSIAGEIRFGWNLVVARLAWYSYSNADFLIVGRVLGKVALGAYSLGWTIASIPVEQVSALVGRVTLGVFSEVQDDPAALRRYLCRLTEGIALITLPASIGMALVADDFVLAILGSKWTGAIVPLRLLSLFAGFRSIMALFPPILVATNNTSKNMVFNLITATVLIPCFLVGANWGVQGVALGWLVGYPVVAAATHMRFALRVTHTPVREYLVGLLPAAGGTIVMAGAVVATRIVTPDVWPSGPRLALQVAAGALTYVAYVWLMHRDRLRRFLPVVASLRGPGN